ncbi:MAG: PEP-CTERM sorting domain-containing protein, partial [Planctomycetales bacterium]|nr:PEP-CTERM sorting domain-containing protein [Planctomycetales bacterium]
ISYSQGDMNGDLANDYDDFLAFRNAYDAANGTGSFTAMLQSIPEPATTSLLCVGVSCLAFLRTQRHRASSSSMA